MGARTAAKTLGFFTAGALAGGTVAVLVTPKTGRAMRKAVTKEYRHRRDSVAKLAHTVAHECHSAFDTSRNRAGKLAAWTRRAS